MIGQVDGKLKELRSGSYKTGANVGQAWNRVVVVEEGSTHDLVISGPDSLMLRDKVGQRVTIRCELTQKPVAGRGSGGFIDLVYSPGNAVLVAIDGKQVERAGKPT